MSTFSAGDEELIFALAEQLTGTCQTGVYRKELLLANVARRMVDAGITSLKAYVDFAQNDRAEREHLVSALTIHTTFWFREGPHFDRLKEDLKKWAQQKSTMPYRVWSAACSTGEEAFSLALVCEDFRITNPGFEYEVFGSDIDPVSVAEAKRSIYQVDALVEIPMHFHKHLRIGSQKTKGLFTLSKEILKRCRFEPRDLSRLDHEREPGHFQAVFCRNVFIYFDQARLNRLLPSLVKMIASNGGVLCLGHSETIEMQPLGLKSEGSSWYRRGSLIKTPSIELAKAPRQHRVLVVDDSKTVRIQIRRLLEAEGLEVEQADSGASATQMVAKSKFDLVTLDLNMDGQDGISWLKEQRKLGLRCPVVIVSESNRSDAHGVIGALEFGAQDYILKTALAQRPKEVALLIKTMAQRLPQSSTRLRVAQLAAKQVAQSPQLIAIGASTGGPQALWELLERFPSPCPPVIVVQHIHHNFSRALIDRIAFCSGLIATESNSGDVLKPGHLYMAQGDHHLKVQKFDGGLRLLHSGEPHPLGHRPSVDVLFSSIAREQVPCTAVILTGMGRDGAQGLLEIRNTGHALTLGQNEESSVVYGMPFEAFKLGAVAHQGSIAELKDALIESFQRIKTNKAA